MLRSVYLVNKIRSKWGLDIKRTGQELSCKKSNEDRVVLLITWDRGQSKSRDIIYFSYLLD